MFASGYFQHYLLKTVSIFILGRIKTAWPICNSASIVKLGLGLSLVFCEGLESGLGSELG